jgi:hypothetical protein
MPEPEHGLFAIHLLKVKELWHEEKKSASSLDRAGHWI